MGNNNFGGQQGVHQGQSNPNQLQFQNTVPVNNIMTQHNHQNHNGGQNYPNQDSGPSYGTIKNMVKLTYKVPFQSTTTKVISSMAQEIKASLQPRTPAAMWGKPDEPKEKTS